MTPGPGPGDSDTNGYQMSGPDYLGIYGYGTVTGKTRLEF